MSSLHELPRSTDSRIRRGRGIAAGRGKTAGRGTKGQKARAGHNIPAGFEGGQTKLYMRLPKRRGEGNAPRPGRAAVTLGTLDRHYKAGERVTVASLLNRGIVPVGTTSVRIVATGALTKSLKFSGVTFSPRVYETLYGKTTNVSAKSSTK